MISGAGSPPLQSWSERHLRAVKLLARMPQAAPLLEFLLELLPAQRELFSWAWTYDWPDAVLSPHEEDFPRIRLSHLPAETLQPHLDTFLSLILPHATEVLAPIGRGLAGDAARQRALLGDFLARLPLDEHAAALGCEPRQVEFFPRAFVQPVAETLAKRIEAVPESWRENFCPACGWPPQLALFQDDAQVKGRRMLECSLCLTHWTFHRAVCPHCGENKADNMEFHTSEATPHLRIDECKSCSAYVKTVDLRKDGMAIPFIDEIAAAELDVWADERGLWKIQANLLGL